MNATITADAAFLDWRARPTRDALRTLLLACQDRVYSLCFQVLRQEQDAEDAAQTSLVEISRSLTRIEDPQAFRSWMYRVALNNALSLRRERVRRMEREKRRAAMNPTAHPHDDLRDAVHDALADLDDDERSLVVEHYFEKATLDDLGARRGVSGVAVWKRIDHAKERMRKSLAGAGLAVGLTQVNSVLEAAEFTPAPPGITFEAALGRLGTVAPSKFTFRLGWLMVAVAAIGFFAVAGPWLRPVLFDRYFQVYRARPLPPVRESSPLELPTPPPIQSPPVAPQEGAGQVVDPDGKPVQGALVFNGRWYRLRGDDAFDPFRPEMIKDGVATDGDGRFRLEPKHPFVSAYHPEFTPVTAKAEAGVTLRFRALGSIRGRMVDADGKPLEGVEVRLDKRGPKQATDKDGRFAFDKVVAGIRGLILPNNRWIAARVEPGEALNVDIGPGLDIALDVSDHPMGPGTRLNGGLMGTSRTSSLLPINGSTPTLQLKGVLPGRYWFGEVRGARGWVDITTGGAKVTFGKASLVVEASEAVEFYLLPAEHNEIIEAALMKMGLMKASPESPCKMLHLVEGGYEIRNREGVTLHSVTLGAGEKTIRIGGK